jgi:hypothetical protein
MGGGLFCGVFKSHAKRCEWEDRHFGMEMIDIVALEAVFSARARHGRV